MQLHFSQHPWTLTGDSDRVFELSGPRSGHPLLLHWLCWINIDRDLPECIVIWTSIQTAD